MKSTQPELAQCDQCSKYILTCWTEGLSASVDLAPLDVNKYRAWIIAKLFTYDLIRSHDNKPLRLMKRNQNSSWGSHEVLGQHPCSASSTKVKVNAAPKVRPPVTFSQVKKAFVPDYSSVRRAKAAQIANRSHIDTDAERFKRWRPKICCVCRVFFTDEEISQQYYVGYYISSSQWWAAHIDVCPRSPAKKGGIPVGRRFNLNG
jgi:hypothetical protein